MLSRAGVRWSLADPRTAASAILPLQGRAFGEQERLGSPGGCHPDSDLWESFLKSGLF